MIDAWTKLPSWGGQWWWHSTWCYDHRWRCRMVPTRKQRTAQVVLMLMTQNNQEMKMQVGCKSIKWKQRQQWQWQSQCNICRTKHEEAQMLPWWRLNHDDNCWIEITVKEQSTTNTHPHAVAQINMWRVTPNQRRVSEVSEHLSEMGKRTRLKQLSIASHASRSVWSDRQRDKRSQANDRWNCMQTLWTLTRQHLIGPLTRPHS